MKRDETSFNNWYWAEEGPRGAKRRTVVTVISTLAIFLALEGLLAGPHVLIGPVLMATLLGLSSYLLDDVYRRRYLRRQARKAEKRASRSHQ